MYVRRWLAHKNFFRSRSSLQYAVRVLPAIPSSAAIASWPTRNWQCDVFARCHISNGGDVIGWNSTGITHPPQDARDGASRHVHPRSLDAEPVGFGASGAWWSSKPAHANGVPLIFNLAGMGSDHPVNSRYKGLRAAPAKLEPWREATRCRHGTRPDPRQRRSPASPPSALRRPSCA